MFNLCRSKGLEATLMMQLVLVNKKYFSFEKMLFRNFGGMLDHEILISPEMRLKMRQFYAKTRNRWESFFEKVL